MSAPIPVLFHAFLRDALNSGETYTSVNIGSVGGTPGGQGSSTGPLNYAMVFDRKDPAKGAVFQANAPNNTTVPNGLSQYLTTDYILFWTSAAFVSSMPQGALFDMLNQNGGGRYLKQVELMSTKMACGINAGIVYLMAAIPAAGLQGLEFMEVQSVSFDGTTGVSKVSPYQMILSLVPAPNGMYSPVEMEG